MITLRRARAINGWMSDAELTFLAETAFKCGVVFEIGSFQGRSTRVLGDNCNGKVHAIDSWASDNYDPNGRMVAFTTDYWTFNLFYCHLADLIEKGRVIPERSTWQDWEPPYEADFIFIDGDHRYRAVGNDIYKGLQWIKRNGIIAGHDYDSKWQDVIQAVNEIFPGKFNVVDTIWWVQL